MYKVASQVNSTWTAPQSYSPSVDVAEVVENQTENGGAAGEPTLSSPTQYGTNGGAALTENAEQKSPLEQVAKVMADEATEVLPVVIDYYSSAVKSEVTKQDGQQGPVASGGLFNGYEAMNQYYQNAMTEEITAPTPIEGTGLRSVMNPQMDRVDGTAAKAASPGSDNPQANRGASRAPVENPQASRGKVAGPSAKKANPQSMFHAGDDRVLYQVRDRSKAVHRWLGRRPMHAAARPPAMIFDYSDNSQVNRGS